MKQLVNICWFRRDLRLHDQAALFHALKAGKPVLPVFIFDINILEELEVNDARVTFIHQELEQLHNTLLRKGSGFRVFHGKPLDAFKTLTSEYEVEAVFTNHDYEDYARIRDGEVTQFLSGLNIALYTYKDQVIFDKEEILKPNASAYTVYSPYSRRWKSKLNEFYVTSYQVEKYALNFLKAEMPLFPALSQLGFKKADIQFPAREIGDVKMKEYDKKRNYPAADGTSRIGLHLRFGTVSIRALVQQALQNNEVFLNELIWREFYMMVLWHFPHVAQGMAFRREFDRIAWRNNEEEFRLWCEGRTGYPLVDAGMRQLNETGYMHNRVRMVTASFLSKHLLIDWRWGEAYFAAKLLDYDFASNNGGWQWSAGTGCDAAPYFRIFNPTLQANKFDPKGEYIRRWVPEFESLVYASPIVDHDFARRRCLQVYSAAVKPA